MLQRTNSQQLRPTSRATGLSFRALAQPASACSAAAPSPEASSLSSPYGGRRESENISDLSDVEHQDDAASSDSDHLEVVEPAASWTSMARRTTNTDAYPLDLEIADLAITMVQESNNSDGEDDSTADSPLDMGRRTPAKLLSMRATSFREKLLSSSSLRGLGNASSQNLGEGRHPSFLSRSSNPRDVSPAPSTIPPQPASVPKDGKPQDPSVGKSSSQLPPRIPASPSNSAPSASSMQVFPPRPSPSAAAGPPSSSGSSSNEPNPPASLSASGVFPASQIQSRDSSTSELSSLTADNNSSRNSSPRASPGKALIPAAVLAAKQKLDEQRGRRPPPQAGPYLPDPGFAGIGQTGGGGIQSHVPYPLSEEELFNLTLVISAQEERYGVNMFDSMLPEDQLEMNRLQAQGYRYEDGALLIFERRYKDPDDPPTPLPLLPRTVPNYSSMVAPAMYPPAGLPMYYPPYSSVMPPPFAPQGGYPYSPYPMAPPMPMPMPMAAPRFAGRPTGTPPPAPSPGPTNS